jgi:hypothetical protein
MPVVDFDGVEGGGFDPIPRGTYHAVFADWETRQTGDKAKHPDKDYYSLEFTVASGPFENRKLWTNAMLPPEYTPFVLKQLTDAAGDLYTDWKKANPDADIEDWLDSMVGELEVNLTVAVKKATKDYDAGNKINGIKAFDESALKGGGLVGGDTKVSAGFAP